MITDCCIGTGEFTDFYALSVNLNEKGESAYLLPMIIISNVFFTVIRQGYP
ncbi:hypothetical protein PEC302110_22030 [Pectobacterium araliae]|uniref:Uncharacterized protein n=1 Tax=Pectobacterium araliae TaxID=3073862 RepID=A0AAN0KF25_9GAMM|nr:hypothetical protein PEC302110_22030 [Pectobacterium sp. MAFF 302110]